LIHNRAGLDRESLVMAVTCLTNLTAQSALRASVMSLIPTLGPLATAESCLVSGEVSALLEVLRSYKAKEGGSPRSHSVEVEGDLDITSVAGDHCDDSLSVRSDSTRSSSNVSPQQQAQLQLAELGARPWSWELELIELEFSQLVGAGSYAEVYHGKLRSSDRNVGIKRFRTKHMSQSEHRQFLNEVHMLASLDHPNILGFVGAVAVEPHFCIVTDFVTPGSLQVILKYKEKYTLPWSRCVAMAADVAHGMAYLHSFSPPIVHRDLKPSNLLVTQDWKVQVCDFGTSRTVVPTGTMSVCGTPVYMAPEVLRGERYDEQADLYSFGIVLWELLTRQVPFQGMIPVVAGMKIAYESLRPPMPAAESLGQAQQLQYAELVVECWAQLATVRPRFEQVVERLDQMVSELGHNSGGTEHI